MLSIRHRITDLLDVVGVPGRAGDVRHVVADPAAARALIGYCPTVAFEAGVRSFATAALRRAATTSLR